MLHKRDSKQEKRGKNLVLVEETIHQSCVNFKYTTPIPLSYWYVDWQYDGNFFHLLDFQIDCNFQPIAIYQHCQSVLSLDFFK